MKKVYQIAILLLCVVMVASGLMAKNRERDSRIVNRTNAPKIEKKSATATETNADRPVQNHQSAVTTSSVQPDVQLPPPPPATQAPAAGEQINWQVLSSGGGSASSTNYKVSFSVGQTAVGLITSTNFQLHQGFWQEFLFGGSGGCCVGVVGDANCNGDVAVSDIGILVDHLFISGTPLCCFEEADANVNSGISVADIGIIVDNLFISGSPLAACP